MKIRAATALALALAFTQVAAPAAFAEQTAFRTAQAQAFSQEDLQRYGLSSGDAAQVHAYQEAGYQVQVMSQEEAERQYAGQFTNSQWLVIGLIVVVVVVVAATAD